MSIALRATHAQNISDGSTINAPRNSLDDNILSHDFIARLFATNGYKILIHKHFTRLLIATDWVQTVFQDAIQSELG